MDRRQQLTWLKRVLVPTFLIALFIASAAIAWASEPAAQATVNVEMRDNQFAPQNVTVNVGDTVTWTNTGQRAHNATARNGAFTSPTMMNGQTFSWTATAAGTYEYVCTFHERGGMVATLVVQGAGGAGGTGGAPTAPPRTGSGGMAGGQSPWFYLVLLVAGLGGSLGLLAGRRRTRSEQPSN
jgi:plastocyanin